MLDATLILLTGLPFTLLIFADTWFPCVPSLLNTNSSLTLYSLPPVTIPTLEIFPGVVAEIVDVWFNLFGMNKYGYSESPSIKLSGWVFLFHPFCSIS